MRSERSHNRWFTSLTADLSESELHSLLSCGQSLHGVYYYDVLTLSSRQPTSSELPWPLEFILRTYSPGHVFGQHRPSHFKLNQQLIHWANRVRWAFKFDGQPKDDPHRSLRRRTNAVFPAPPASDSVEHYIGDGIGKLGTALGSRCRKWTKNHSNLNKLSALGFKIAKQGLNAIARTDKDGGFVIFPRHHSKLIVDNIVGQPQYALKYLSGYDYGPLV